MTVLRNHVTEEKLTAFAGGTKIVFPGNGGRGYLILNILKRMTGCWSAIKYRAIENYYHGKHEWKNLEAVVSAICQMIFREK